MLLPVASKVLSLIYPNRCVICDRLCEDNPYFCPQCKDDFAKFPYDECPLCGCHRVDCRCTTPLNSGAAFLYYEQQGKDIVLSLKAGNKRNAARYLAQGMADTFRKIYTPESFDLITYVPSNKASLRKRGYNQAEWLASHVGKLLEIPVVGNLLSRSKNSMPQHEANFMQRQQNAQNSYRLKSPPPPASRILLIDDIITTGATLQAIAQRLKESGAGKVSCLCAASTKIRFQ